MKSLLIITLLISSGFAAEGRYQLITHPVSPNRTLMIDTTNGKIWAQVCYVPKADGVGCEYTAWTQEDIIGITTDGAKVEKTKNIINEYLKSKTQQ